MTYSQKEKEKIACFLINNFNNFTIRVLESNKPKDSKIQIDFLSVLKFDKVNLILMSFKKFTIREDFNYIVNTSDYKTYIITKEDKALQQIENTLND